MNNFQGNLIIAPDRDRAIYASLKKKAPKNIITPSYLRMEQQLSSGQGTYNFDMKKNSGNSSQTENRLDLNDAFVATRIGIYLLNDDPALPGKAALQTFPSPVGFPAEANNVDPEHLEAFYNGYLQVKVGTTVYAESMATRKFRHVPTTQQDVVAAVPPPSAMLSGATGYDGLMELTPQFIFQGQAKNQLSLVIPANSTQQAQYKTATTRIKVVWYMEGFLISQGSGLGTLVEG